MQLAAGVDGGLGWVGQDEVKSLVANADLVKDDAVETGTTLRWTKRHRYRLLER
jgi:hypothetical protein